MASLDNITHKLDTSKIRNKELLKLTNTMIGYGITARKYNLAIAATLSIIKNNPLLTEDFNDEQGKKGFENYANVVLGLSRSQAFAAASVGERFLDDKGNCTLFQPENSNYTKTQLQRLLPLPDDIVTMWADTGEITPEMTAGAIERKVKDYLNPKKEKGEGDNDSEDGNTNEEEDNIIKSAFDNIDTFYELSITINGEGKPNGVMCKNRNNEIRDISSSRIGRYLIKNFDFIHNAMNAKEK